MLSLKSPYVLMDALRWWVWASESPIMILQVESYSNTPVWWTILPAQLTCMDQEATTTQDMHVHISSERAQPAMVGTRTFTCAGKLGYKVRKHTVCGWMTHIVLLYLKFLPLPFWWILLILFHLCEDIWSAERYKFKNTHTQWVLSNDEAAYLRWNIQYNRGHGHLSTSLRWSNVNVTHPIWRCTYSVPIPAIILFQIGYKF